MMADSAADRMRRHRDKKRGGPARSLKPCGTPAAKQRHRDNPEEHGTLESCEECRPRTLVELSEAGEL